MVPQLVKSLDRLDSLSMYAVIPHNIRWLRRNTAVRCRTGQSSDHLDIIPLSRNAFEVSINVCRFLWCIFGAVHVYLTRNPLIWFIVAVKKQQNGAVLRTNSMGPCGRSPPHERKSKFSAIGRFFKPWKWRRKKKSEKFEETSKCKCDLIAI